MGRLTRRHTLTAEQIFHISAAEYLDLALPEHAAWTTFPAGGGGKTRGGILKAMGLKAGWPDIQILVRATAFDSARSMCRFIGLELKSKDGLVTKAQTDRHALIKKAGGQVYVVRTIDDIYSVLTKFEHLRLKAKPS